VKKIKVVDAIMGSGKTSAAINKINNDEENKYIFITPYLDEVDRIIEKCNNKKFYSPKNIGQGKLESLHNLLSKGCNIASTHALFKTYDEKTEELLRLNNYILILDEVCDVVEQLQLKKDDLPSILELGLATIEDDFLIWNSNKIDYDGKYDDIKTMALNKNLIVVNNCLLMWNFPVDVFKAFKQVYILSYMFDAQIQKYYYDYHKVEYEYYGTKYENGKYYFSKEYILPTYVKQLKNKISIIEDDKINDVGDKETSLSVSWFKRELIKKSKDRYLIKTLKKNILNFFTNKMKSTSKETMWTTFKDCKDSLSGQGYTKGFVSVNARATNEFADRIYLAYCVNIYLNPLIKQFFEKKGIEVDEGKYALSEMIQWIWRSRIRWGMGVLS
jgi:hypothetical protein